MIDKISFQGIKFKNNKDTKKAIKDINSSPYLHVAFLNTIEKTNEILGDRIWILDIKYTQKTDRSPNKKGEFDFSGKEKLKCTIKDKETDKKAVIKKKCKVLNDSDRGELTEVFKGIETLALLNSFKVKYDNQKIQ